MPVLSTEDQNLDLQIDHLTKDGYSKILTEKLTGRNNARPALDKVLKLLRPGDMLVVWKLDCLGRSLKDLINILQVLETRKIGFRSITDSIDTETATGRLLFHVIGAIAEYECVQISEGPKPVFRQPGGVVNVLVVRSRSRRRRSGWHNNYLQPVH